MQKQLFYWPTLLLLSLSLSACFQTRQELAAEKKQQQDEQQTEQSDEQSIEDLQRNVGALQGKLEEIDHNYKQQASGQATNVDDLNKKFTAVSARLDAIEQKQELMFQEITKIKEANLQAASAPPPVAAAAVAKTKGYDTGISAYKAAQYDQAIDSFTHYLKYSKSQKRAMEANYYLGESYYQLKNYSQAILAYSNVQDKMPHTQLGRSSTLRIAESFHALGKDKDAKAFAQILVNGDPKSDEAKRARKYLK